MSDLAVKILWALGTKLFTDVFVAKFIVHGLRQVAKSTTNTLDDQWVSDTADALGVK